MKNQLSPLLLQLLLQRDACIEVLSKESTFLKIYKKDLQQFVIYVLPIPQAAKKTKLRRVKTSQCEKNKKVHTPTMVGQNIYSIKLQWSCIPSWFNALEKYQVPDIYLKISSMEERFRDIWILEQMLFLRAGTVTKNVPIG